jgi:hypothetical protein
MTGPRPDGNRYESALERDYMVLVEGHPDYKSYHAQPVWIEYVNPLSGQVSRYPPDGLVQWKSDRRPLLVEVKYRQDCVNKWREFRAKFRAAKNLANNNGWDFAVITEEAIRGPQLFNVNFLVRYKRRALDPDISDAVRTTLAKNPAAIKAVAQVLSDEGWDPDAVVSCCWTMVASGQLYIDMDVKVTQNTVLSVLP